MKWLITGGCGFIGTSLIARLVAEGGHSIRVVDNLSVGQRSDLARVCDYTEKPEAAPVDPIGAVPVESSARIELIVGDILDAELAVAGAAGAEVIVHLAANTGVPASVEEPRKDCMANVVGIFNYLEAARSAGVKRFVFASSGAPVGECTPPIHEEIVPRPVSPYGASKLAGEAYCSAYFRSFGIDTIALRFGNVYGPGSTHKSSVVARFIKQAIAGEAWQIYGSGRQTRDFIFIEDLLAAITQAATVPGIGGEIFQIATSRECSVRELAESLALALQRRGIARPEVRHEGSRPGDVLRNFSDTGKAMRMLGWRAQTSLDEGIEKTVRWFLATRQPFATGEMGNACD